MATTDKTKIWMQTISVLGLVGAFVLEIVGTERKSTVILYFAAGVGIISAVVVFCFRFPKGYKPRVEPSARFPFGPRAPRRITRLRDIAPVSGDRFTVKFCHIVLANRAL